MKTIKVIDLPIGSILWKGKTIIGVKGMTLSDKLNEFECEKVVGDNILDYELITDLKLKDLRRMGVLDE